MLVEDQPAALPNRSTASKFKRGDVFLLLGLLAVALASLSHLRVLDRYSLPASASDLAQVWVGVRVSLAGADPYGLEATREIQRIYYGHQLDASDTRTSQRFAYPAQTAVVLAPLALLSWPAAKSLYLWTIPLLFSATVPLWLELLGIAVTRRGIVLLLTLVLVSWPVVWGIRLEQLTLLVMVFLAAGCWLLRSGQQVSAGIVLSLATIKPQVAGLLLAWLLLWAVLHGCWRFAASLLAATALLLAAAQAIQPGWFSRWAAALVDYSHYTKMTPVLVSLFGRWVGGAMILALSVACGWLLWRMRAAGPKTPAFGAACALALAETASLLPPMSGMIYNQVLLLPGLVFLWHGASRIKAFAGVRRLVFFLVAFQYGSVPIAWLGETLQGPAKLWLALPFWNLILPATALLGLCIYLWSPATQGDLSR